jgi:hypothetical protein
MIYTTQNTKEGAKLKKTGVSSGAPEGQAVPASYKRHIVLLIYSQVP